MQVEIGYNTGVEYEIVVFISLLYFLDKNRFIKFTDDLQNRSDYDKILSLYKKFSESIRETVFAKIKPKDIKDILLTTQGMTASNTFASIASGDIKDIKQTRKDLLAYCKMDTLAMVKIYDKLINLD